LITVGPFVDAVDLIKNDPDNSYNPTLGAQKHTLIIKPFGKKL
jgi:hypothetical protein